jgi:hypothetical protein
MAFHGGGNVRTRDEGVKSSLCSGAQVGFGEPDPSHECGRTAAEIRLIGVMEISNLPGGDIEGGEEIRGGTVGRHNPWGAFLPGTADALDVGGRALAPLIRRARVLSPVLKARAVG